MTAKLVRVKIGQRRVCHVVVTALVATTTGCATGYGTLAAAGAGAALGTIGMAAAAGRGESVDGRYVLGGALAGALFGVIGAAVAGAVGRHEGQKQALAEANKPKNAASYEDRIQALEQALRERTPAPEQQTRDTPLDTMSPQ